MHPLKRNQKLDTKRKFSMCTGTWQFYPLQNALRTTSRHVKCNRQLKDHL
nr:MAG TPA: hypothetical protein [Caudoviricetes sp.]